MSNSTPTSELILEGPASQNEQVERNVGVLGDEVIRSVQSSIAVSGPAAESAPTTLASDAGQSAEGDLRRNERSPEDRQAWLRRGDQLVVWLLVTSLLILLGIQWARLSRWGSSPIELSSQAPLEYYYSVEINSASWVEWAQLDGIGEKLARRIVADRDERGPFRSISDVSRVKGIGPKILEKIRPFLQCKEQQSATPVPAT